MIASEYFGKSRKGGLFLWIILATSLIGVGWGMFIDEDRSVQVKLELIMPGLSRIPFGDGYMGTISFELSEVPYRDVIYESVRDQLQKVHPWISVKLTDEGIRCTGLNI